MPPGQSKPLQVPHHCSHNDSPKSVCLTPICPQSPRTVYQSHSTHLPQDVPQDLRFYRFKPYSLSLITTTLLLSCMPEFWVTYMLETCKSVHTSLSHLLLSVHGSESSHPSGAHSPPCHSRCELRAPSAGNFQNYNSFEGLSYQSDWLEIIVSPQNEVGLPTTAGLAPGWSVSSE